MNNPIEALRRSRYGATISAEERAAFQRAVTPHAPTTQRSDGMYLNETAQRMFYLWLYAVDWAMGECVRGVLQPAASPAPSAKQEPSEEVLALHRALASEKLRADQGWERAEAKSRECIELRERIASPAAPAVQVAGSQQVPEGYALVPVEPVTGERYSNGEWSRRNWEAALADQAAAAPAVPVPVERFDFHAHLARQAAFSLKTFGPGMRTAGVCDHIRKELKEIEADPSDLREWIDVVILALDGAWRCGGSPEQIIDGIVAKQTKNEGRNWPDWRTADPNKAIEHDRSGEAAPSLQQPKEGSTP